MRLQMRCIDHQRISPSALIGLFQKHPSEDPLLAPSLPPAVKRLVWPILRRRIAPTQAIAIDEYYATQHPLVVHARFAMGLRKKKVSAWPAAHRSASKGRSCHRSVFGAVNHAAQQKSMHPDPKVHHPEYNFNDEAIPAGCSWWAEIVERRMPAAQLRS